MKTFDLNESTYDGGGNVAIFNGGEAGRVDNCSIKLERTKQEDKENPNSPDYKLIFTDSTGAEANLGMWYPKETDTDENIIRFLKKLKHIAHVFCGEDAQLPKGNPRAILDGVMKMCKETGMQAPVRVFVNYGTNGYEKKYLTVRSFVPFLESMTVPVDETRLKPSSIENMVRPAAEETSGSVATTGSGDDDWD